VPKATRPKVARGRALLLQNEITQGIANMEDHETRRKIIREWMAQ
jgi:hypothetical protein